MSATGIVITDCPFAFTVELKISEEVVASPAKVTADANKLVVSVLLTSCVALGNAIVTPFTSYAGTSLSADGA